MRSTGYSRNKTPCRRPPSAAVKTAVAAGGAQLLVLNVDGADPVTALESNVDQLIKTLSP